MKTEKAVWPLEDVPELLPKAAKWFSEKWGIPEEEYRKSMRECLAGKAAVPRWYVVLGESAEIAAGAGVIQNDFHERKDLFPNLCALYVEKAYRKKGIARMLLNYARADMGRRGFLKLYLITGHTEFYEKCGWRFFTMVREEDGALTRMYVADTLV